MENRLYFGDNLDVMRHQIKDESVDLIYLDPPFNSQANYNVLFKESSGADSQAQAEAFQDNWLWGEVSAAAYDDIVKHGGDTASLLRTFKSWLGDAPLMAYLAMMAVRLIELKRIIRPGGSIYLHCDPTASHYVKLIMDAIFSQSSYRNEVVWLRSKNPKGSQHKSKRYGPATDSLLFYADGDDYFYDPEAIRISLSSDEIAQKYPSSDSIGPFADGPILRSASMGSRPNLVYEYKGFTPGLAGWRMEREALEELDRRGNLAWTRTGAPRRKLRPDDDRGDPVGSFWGDIPPLNSQAKERLGYPTQKPVALLERIILASSKPESVIFDPFCGCGTTVHAAQKLGRQWVGIDIAHYAVTLIDNRLKKHFLNSKYSIYGRPTDLSGAVELAKRNKYQFQWWACWLLGVQTYETKKGADRGIDGNIFFQNGPFGFGRIIVSVKGGLNVGPAMVRELAGVVQREEAEMGILILLVEPTRAMTSDAAGLGFVEKSAHGRLPRIQITTIENLLELKMPKLPPLPLPERMTPAKVKRDKDQLELLLPFEGVEAPVNKDIVVDPRFMRGA